ncbi:MAG: UvrD-helicase domain-containing protein [Clostridia bacterium]|nr:UvrD-helicase domain-containing protein [Clostridia bacterium]
MAREWTIPQRAAIEARNRTLLVSAAAGSGKTAVLTERIIRLLTDPEDPADISRMLIVTFTRAAAGELRQRISKALSEAIAKDPANEKLTRQLMLLGSAHISTIDSFYLDLVKTNFQSTGLPPTFRMADDTELTPIKKEIMDDVVDTMYMEYPDFSQISDIFCDIRNEDSICTTLIGIADALHKYPESIDILLRSAREIEEGAIAPLDTSFGKVWLRSIQELAQEGFHYFGQALREMQSEGNDARVAKRFGDVYREYYERCAELLQAIERLDYTAIRSLLTLSFAHRLAGGKMPPMSPAFVDMRGLCDHFRDKWKASAQSLGAFSAEEIIESATETAHVLRLLHTTLQRFETAYAETKRTREVAEFSDISRAAYHLLVDQNGNRTALARELSETFDAVYIDEYQDVDAMQDATFRAISKERNRFMVGDIKQSIYRFRGAQPTVFANYRKHFPLIETADSNAPEVTVFMSDCFRCDENVIRFSNAVSGYLFSRSAESIGYTKEDDLRFSKIPPNAEYQSPKCCVMLADRLAKDEREETDEDPKSAELEAKMIATEIHRLTTDPTARKADGSPIGYGDIAILMRSTTIAPFITKELNAYGIPTNDTSRRSFFENPEVLCMYSLLAAIDNPFRDVYLAAAMRSPFFGFTLEDMVRIHAAGDHALSLYEAVGQAAQTLSDDTELAEKIKDFTERLAVFREKAESLSVNKLLRYLYRETAVLAFAGYETDDKGTPTVRRQNLHRLYEYARTFEAGGFKGLHQFIEYVDHIMANDTKMPAPEGDPDAISLITIHHSKGLEYPVCFLVGTATRFNTDDLKPTLLADEHLGCATRLCNAGPFSRTNTFFRQAISLELKRQNKEEEMRVLYVAMTRARERLYVTAAPRYGADRALQKAELFGSSYAAPASPEGNCYLDWILTALMRPDREAFSKLIILPEPAILSGETVTSCEAMEAVTLTSSPKEIISTLEERFAYRYPYQHLTKLPAKLSVSRLSPVVLDVFDNDYAPSDVFLSEDASEQLLHTFDRAPEFGKKSISAAERGTATHEFLQFCDFANAERNGIAKELDRLIDERYLSPDIKDAVRQNELEAFFKSAFYHSLSQASALHRETRFNIFLPASDFTSDSSFAQQLSGERLLVQGVIDLFFTDPDGKLVLCDYKTDRLSPFECSHPNAAARMLSDRHGKQLSYYAMALAEICGKRPDKILIYSLPLGEAVEAILPNK